MTRSQRQSCLNRHFAETARAFAQEKGLVFAGTLRRMPPPVFPGAKAEPTRYFVNALFPAEEITRLVELDRARRAALALGERWVEEGAGEAPWERNPEATPPKRSASGGRRAKAQAGKPVQRRMAAGL